MSPVKISEGIEMRCTDTGKDGIVYQRDLCRGGQGGTDIVFSGYFPGALGRIIEAHGRYYSEVWGFDSSFETQEGAELSEFFARFTEGRDFLRVAQVGGDFAGSIVVDGSSGGPDGARLRWFIVDPRFQGRGIGNALISEAMDFCLRAGHDKVNLWTFEGLDTARHLYEKAGFRLADERRVRQWGRERINEQKFLFEKSHG